MNYLVTEGYADAARQFSLESGTVLASTEGNESGRRKSFSANWRVCSPPEQEGDGQETSMDVDPEPATAPTPSPVPTSTTTSSPSLAIRTIDSRMAVRSHVNRGHIPDAINLLNDLDPMLLEEKDDIYFRLQQQQLIELIRNQKVEEAIEFAQKYLAPRGEDNVSFIHNLHEESNATKQSMEGIPYLILDSLWVKELTNQFLLVSLLLVLPATTNI